MQTDHRPVYLHLLLPPALAVGLLAGCNAQGSSSSVPHLPDRVVVWSDPQDGESQGITVRDANNDDDSFVLIGTDNTVQFMPTPKVCNDCSVDGSTITLGGGQLIDIRFGVGAVGESGPRPFLVDRESGRFIQLVGGGNAGVTFQVTDTALEEDDNSSDDLARRADDAPNPAKGADSSGQGGPIGGLCGALGMVMVLLLPAALLGWRFSRAAGRALKAH